MIGEGTQEHTDARRGGTRIQSVARACQLLLWLADRRHGAAAKEIAFAHRLTLPTTYHLLNTLVDQGLLAKDEERRFVLGSKLRPSWPRRYLRESSVPESLLSRSASSRPRPRRSSVWPTGTTTRSGFWPRPRAQCAPGRRDDERAVRGRPCQGERQTAARVRLARAARVVHAPPSATAAHARHDLRHARIRRRARADPPARAAPTTSRNSPRGSRVWPRRSWTTGRSSPASRCRRRPSGSRRRARS